MALRTVEIPRMAAGLARFGDRLRARHFTEGERAYCVPKRKAPQHFAARMAAKFAGRQVLGRGRLRDFEIVRDAAGCPSFILHGEAAKAAAGQRLLLSLSHDGDLAVALVVSEDAT